MAFIDVVQLVATVGLFLLLWSKAEGLGVIARFIQGYSLCYIFVFVGLLIWPEGTEEIQFTTTQILVFASLVAGVLHALGLLGGEGAHATGPGTGGGDGDGDG